MSTYTLVTVTVAHDRHLFEDPVFRADFLARMRRLPDDGCIVVAYAIMSAHAHLIIEHEGAGTLSHGMQRLLAPSGWLSNVRVQEVGPVYTRPFHRSPMESAAHRWWAPLYVHANPVPRGSTGASAGWRSSHDAWLRGGEDSWVRPGALLDQYGGVAGYRRELESYLSTRCHPALPNLEPSAQAAVLAVARARGTNPATLLDGTRGGKEDRQLLAYGLVKCLGWGGLRAGEVLDAPGTTVRQWAARVASREDLAGDVARIAAALG